MGDTRTITLVNRDQGVIADRVAYNKVTPVEANKVDPFYVIYKGKRYGVNGVVTSTDNILVGVFGPL
jgi:hypothetical protein